MGICCMDVCRFTAAYCAERIRPLVSVPPLLQLSGIGKSFGSVRVLEDVSFVLQSGEVHLLAGENGAGKSTLIKILAGIYQEYDGEIRLEGKVVRFMSPHEANRRGISVIHQEMSLVDSLGVADNIFLGREPVRAAGKYCPPPR